MVEAAVAWRCSACGETKPETDFHRANTRGKRCRSVQYACKACQAERGRTRERKEAAKAWTAANREKVNEWNRAHYHNVAKHSEGFLLARAEYSRWYRRIKKYGITKDQYESLMVAQAGKCAICEDEQWFDLRVDHCHDSQRVRGLLCANCNAGIGLLKEAPEILHKAVSYLETRKQL